MPDLPQDRTEKAFDDKAPRYTDQQAVLEASRCLFCEDAPCAVACPTHIDIPGFIRKIATGNVRGSAATIFRSNVLGMSCARVCPVEVLCVGACVHNHQGVEPIAIGRLQRYATDTAYERGWRFFERAPDTGRTVGLVGAGPASLACAHELARRGHRAVVYERRRLPGGLNVSGVAPYKMQADAALAEVDWVLGIGGIELRTGAEIEDFTALEREHDAVFLGVGLGADRRLGIPGEELAGVEGAVAFIERLKLGRVDVSRVRAAAVIGGGNTAVDAVRELAGLGVPRVQLVYRGGEGQMSGYRHEWRPAREAGVQGVFHAAPVRFTGSERVSGVICRRTDADKRPIPGTDFALPADLVLLAAGQEGPAERLRGIEGLAFEGRRLVADADGALGRPGWFAGGDCVNGGKEVVNAVAEGKRAAIAIDRWLREGGSCRT